MGKREVKRVGIRTICTGRCKHWRKGDKMKTKVRIDRRIATFVLVVLCLTELTTTYGAEVGSAFLGNRQEAAQLGASSQSFEKQVSLCRGSATITWTAGDANVSYNVYFGDEAARVASGEPDTFRGNQTDTAFVAGRPGSPFPDGLVPGRTYYFRIDVVEIDGTVHPGSIWSFRAGPDCLFVDGDATGANNGCNWDDAFVHLQDALAAATLGEEIWVAEGVYKPDQGSGQIALDRTSTFQLKNAVALYGGFVGTETDRDQRDWVAHETILSGDMVGDDDPNDWTGYIDNSYHVVTGSGTDATALLSGFTILGGDASGSTPYDDLEDYGGGMLNDNGSPTVESCTFRHNWARYGGGMANINLANPLVTDCTFMGNRASHGGGMYNGGQAGEPDGPGPVVIRCSFLENSASEDGGAMYTGRRAPTLVSCFLAGNSTKYGKGGAIVNWAGALTLIQCVLSGNRAGSDGGAVYAELFATTTLLNCTLYGNSTDDGYAGGALASRHRSELTISNSIIWGNRAAGIPQQITSISWMRDPNGTMVLLPAVCVRHSVLEGGRDGIHQSLYAPWLCTVIGVIEDYPAFIDPNGTDGLLGTQDDNLRLLAVSPCIDAGNNETVPAELTTDLDGRPRFLDSSHKADTGTGTAPLVDMGAYECDRDYPIIYVDADAIGNNDGSSWANAYPHLQDGMLAAVAECEIRVAQGIYRPDEGAEQTIGDRAASFRVGRYVTIRGGYAGLGELDPDEREPQRHKTVLSGDIGVHDWHGDNAHHVVIASETDPTAMLDGLVIQGGNADGDPPFDDCGGGILIRRGNLTVQDCNFVGNRAARDGGGIFNTLGGLTLRHCVFQGNSAGAYGGGMYSEWSRPAMYVTEYHVRWTGIVVERCTFFQNAAAQAGGGAAFNGDRPHVACCWFLQNRAPSGGGAASMFSSSPELINCIFGGNMSEGVRPGDGGGGLISWGGLSLVTHCTFVGNSAVMFGGSLLATDEGRVEVANTIMWAHAASFGASISVRRDGRVSVESSDIEGGWPDAYYDTGGGFSVWDAYTIDEDPLFRDMDGPDNILGTTDDDLRLLPGSPCIDVRCSSRVLYHYPDYLSWVDMDGNPRVADDPATPNPDPIPADMGAYEFGPEPSSSPYTSVISCFLS